MISCIEQWISLVIKLSYNTKLKHHQNVEAYISNFYVKIQLYRSLRLVSLKTEKRNNRKKERSGNQMISQIGREESKPPASDMIAATSEFNHMVAFEHWRHSFFVARDLNK